MAKGKKSEQKTTQQVDDTQEQVQDQVQDQPESEGDIFDEDEAAEQGPPRLPDGHPDSADATEKPQDAPGEAPTTLKDEEAKEAPGRVPGDGETAANEALLATKGDLQPTLDQRRADPVVQGAASQPQTGQLRDLNDPEFRNQLRQFLTEEMKRESGVSTPVQVQSPGQDSQSPRGDQDMASTSFKVIRGMVGAFPEGSVVPDFKSLGIQASDIQRLLDAGVIMPFQADPQS